MSHVRLRIENSVMSSAQVYKTLGNLLKSQPPTSELGIENVYCQAWQF